MIQQRINGIDNTGKNAAQFSTNCNLFLLLQFWNIVLLSPMHISFPFCNLLSAVAAAPLFLLVVFHLSSLQESTE